MRKTPLLLALAALAAAVAAVAPALADVPKHHLWFGAVHADVSLQLKDGSASSFNWDRGKITAISDGSVSIVRRDKQELSFTVDASTLVRNEHASYSLADLKVGQRASFFSRSGYAFLIRRIRGADAPSGAAESVLKDGPFHGAVTGSAALLYKDGSTQSVQYDRAQITAKDASSLTLKRADGSTLSLAYDAGTLVRERGQTVSIDTLEVGERAMFFSQGGKALLIRCVSKPKK